jgi:hypothetical protein
VKMAILPKRATDSLQFPSKLQWLSSQNRKTNPKIYMDAQKTPNNQKSPEEDDQCW